jgi:DNA polymerase eta
LSSGKVSFDMSTGRAILHVDLDAFYAQVEIVRLQKPVDTALVVVQWGSVLAVSYGARRFGIRRGDKVADVIRKRGSEIVEIVAVETIGSGGIQTGESASNDEAIKNSQKVSLARYREASAQVFKVIESVVDRVERASIDECFIDVTRLANIRLGSRSRSNQACALGLETALLLPANTVVIGDAVDPGLVHDQLLCEAASISSEIRSAVWRDCSFTCSAGIATNKLLAKFASAENKPNMQTMCPHSAVTSLLDSVPLRRLRGCGGKLGDAVEALGALTAGEVREKLSMVDLQRAVGQKHASFIWNIARGRDDSAVIPRSKLNTILAAKNFESTRDIEKAASWLEILARELLERLKFEEASHLRIASSLTLSFRVYGCEMKGMTTASRTRAMPGETCKDRERAIIDVARACLDAALDGPKFTLPISFLGLTAGNFVERASRSSIARFLGETQGSKAIPLHRGPTSCDLGNSTSAEGSGTSMPVPPVPSYVPRHEHTVVGTLGISAYFKKRCTDILPETCVSETEHARLRRHQEAADLEYARRLAREESRKQSRASPFLRRKAADVLPPK